MQRWATVGLLICLFVVPTAWSADRGPVLRKAVGPVYPDGALPLAPDNTIIAGIRVSPEGAVEDVRVLHSEHPGLGFEDAATEAIRQWDYRPARADGQRVSAFEVVSLQFVAPSRLAPVPSRSAAALDRWPNGYGVPAADAVLGYPGFKADRPRRLYVDKTPAARAAGRTVAYRGPWALASYKASAAPAGARTASSASRSTPARTTTASTQGTTASRSSGTRTASGSRVAGSTKRTQR